MARTRTPLSDEEHAERRRRDRERVERAARELLDSDGWKRWVRTRARFHRYSLHNTLLIAHQRPDATRVAGFRAWLALNRCVRKGERAIYIWAPMRVKERDPATGEESGEPRTLFRLAPIFDVSQTDPLPDTEPIALEPPREPITGDSHAHLLPPLHALAAELFFAVRTAPIHGRADGWCDPVRKEIVVRAELPPNARVRVLVHELAHALGVTYESHSRPGAEVIVDTATFVVCAGVGLDTGGESIPYVAGWGETGSLDAVRAAAETIDAIARRIEAAISPRVTAGGAP
jgi:hypothetical protein